MGNTARDYSKELYESRSGKTSPADLHVHNAADKDIKYGNNNGEGDNHAERLAEARENETPGTSEAHGSKAKDLLNDAKNIAELATPMGAMSLLKYVNFLGDMPYVAAMGAALLKDLIDLGTFETVVLPILFAMMCSIFIFMMMLITGSSGNKKIAKTILKKIGILLGGGIADSIPGLNFLPIEMVTVAIIYVLELVDRKKAAKN